MPMLPIVKADGVDLDPAEAPTTPAALMDPVVAAEPDADAGGCGCGGCGCGGGEAAEGGALSEVQPEDLDVRTIAHAQRHPRIFAAVDALEPGESFVLANDHDPKPLRFQLEAREPGQIAWTYLAEGPDIWRVRISRADGHCC